MKHFSATLPATRRWGLPQMFAIATATLLGTLITPQLAAAESVLEKIDRTGTLTAGTNADALPFAFADDQGTLQGYSIDMLKQIQAQLTKELGKKIELQLTALTPEQRIPKLVAGEVDIVCDASSYTWKREEQIDFSVSYGFTGTRLLAKRGSEPLVPEAFANKRIAAVAGTTNEIAIRRTQPEAQILVVDTHEEGYEALKQDTVDAFAADGILLEGWLQTTDNRDSYGIIGYFSREGIACMVPENNSKFVDQVNYSLVRFMGGYLEGKEPYVAIFDRWFGPQAQVPLSQDLRALVLETMQLVIDFKEEVPESDL